MKLPREVGGEELAGLLRIHGYQVSRQTGNPLRLTTLQGGEHHETIRRHKPLRIGTLGNVLKDIAEHLGMEREELVESLFGK